MKTLISHFEKDGSGVTAIEYALIAASIAGAIMAVVVGLGSELQTTFSGIASAMDAPSAQASSDTGSSDTDSSDAGHRRSSDRRSWDRDGSDRRPWDGGSFDHDHFNH